MKLFSLLLLLIPFSYLEAKVTLGRVEWVEFPEMKLKLKARIDTGAKTNSLHAQNIEEYIDQGILYVKFKTFDSNGELKEVMKKVSSTQKVINTTGNVGKRYVISEMIKIGKWEKEVLINLNDRTKLDYKFLVGRNTLFGNFLVDVSKSHVLGDQ